MLDCQPFYRETMNLLRVLERQDPEGFSTLIGDDVLHGRLPDGASCASARDWDSALGWVLGELSDLQPVIRTRARRYSGIRGESRGFTRAHLTIEVDLSSRVITFEGPIVLGWTRDGADWRLDHFDIHRLECIPACSAPGSSSLAAVRSPKAVSQ